MTVHSLSPVLPSSHPHPTTPPFLHCRYNKREGDFHGLREYNDYLEQVEDIGTAAAAKEHLRK